MHRRLIALAVAAALAVLAGCTTTEGPLWRPDSPRNGANQPVDPVYGTPIPGYPNISGCS